MSELRVLCPRCGVVLLRVGRRDFHFGQVFRHDAGRVNQMSTEVFVCGQCGHLELFHPKIGTDGRSENPPLSFEELPPSDQQ
jgi:hypothetical protein